MHLRHVPGMATDAPQSGAGHGLLIHLSQAPGMAI